MAGKATGRLDSDRRRLRRADQAAARVQAPASQRHVHPRSVLPDQGRPRHGRRPARLHLRRQGRPRIQAGEGHYQVHQRSRPRRQQRPRHEGPHPRRFRRELQRDARRVHHPRRRCLRADLDGRKRGLGNVEHEVHDERRPHARHARRRQRGNRRCRRRGQRLHLRSPRGGAPRASPQLRPPPPLRDGPGAQARHGRLRRRHP